MKRAVSRRQVLAGAGALIVAFQFTGAYAQTETGTGGGPSKLGLPGSLDDTPKIDAWIRVDASGAITVLTGKAELGQGLKTALLQVAAEELKVPLNRLSLVTADTARTPNEGYTAASHSMQDSGTAIRHAAAQARDILVDEAARKWGVASSTLKIHNGEISSMRSLGGYLNVLSIESVMDELAVRSRQDPVSFRLRHTQDSRARAVIETAASRFGWATRAKSSDSTGFGFGFGRYKNLEAWCAVAVEVGVQRQSGVVQIRRVGAAVDTGQVANPDGIRNQIEGGILQSMSWTLFEQVTFDRTRVTSVDWSAYPIMRFDSVPGSVEVHLIDRPGDAFYGVAEAAQGPSGAAIANALRDATGVRMHDLPFTPAGIRKAIGT